MSGDETAPRGADSGSEAVLARRGADQLAEVLQAMEAVDLNGLLVDEDVRTFLDAKDELSEICLRLRRHHRSAEDRREPSEEAEP